eukprot:4301395-Alexandrium_andersonii.AAC.1
MTDAVALLHAVGDRSFMGGRWQLFQGPTTAAVPRCGRGGRLKTKSRRFDRSRKSAFARVPLSKSLRSNGA